MGDLNELVERLQEHAILLGGFHFNNAEEGRGSATRQVNASTLREANALFSSAASKANQAAAALTSLIAERDAYAQSCKDLGGIVRHNIARAKALEAIIQDHGSAKQIRLATALSPDTNKGDGV